MDLSIIARNLERERCFTHKEKPSAIPKRDSIEISCCCEDFKSKLIKIMELEISKQIEKDIKKALRF